MEPHEILEALIAAKYDGNQAAFSRAIKRSPSQVNQWLSGYRKLDVKGQRHIEKALDLPADYFLGQAPDHINESRYQLTAEQPVRPYSSRALVLDVCECAEKIDDTGLQELIRFAQCLAQSRPFKPRQKREAA